MSIRKVQKREEEIVVKDYILEHIIMAILFFSKRAFSPEGFYRALCSIRDQFLFLQNMEFRGGESLLELSLHQVIISEITTSFKILSRVMILKCDGNDYIVNEIGSNLIEKEVLSLFNKEELEELRKIGETIGKIS